MQYPIDYPSRFGEHIMNGFQ